MFCFSSKHEIFARDIFGTTSMPSATNGLKRSDFIPEFDQFMHEMYITNTKTVLLGDFNVHVELTTSEATKFMDSLQSFGLQQHVSGPTHKNGHTLDLVIANPDDQLIKSCDVLPSLGSDHHVIRCKVSIEKTKPSKLTKSIRNFKTMDSGKLKKDLAMKLNNYISHGDVNTYCEFFVSTLTDVLDKHAPSKQCSRSTRTRSPWYNSNIHVERRERRKLERRWRKQPTAENHAVYLEQNCKVVKLITDAKITYYKEVLEEADSKSMYQTVNKLLNKGKSSKPNCKSLENLTNDFAEFFVSKVSKIREGLDELLLLDNAIPSKCVPSVSTEINNHDNDVQNVKHNVIECNNANLCAPSVSTEINNDVQNVKHNPIECNNANQFSTFKQVTEEQMSKIIMGLSNKACVLDPFPMWLFKECLPELLPTITNIVNESLATGVFPIMLREAVVLPLLKKQSLDPNVYKNYRPVSNICYISKIIEKIVAKANQ
jgi:hypothetical protein